MAMLDPRRLPDDAASSAPTFPPTLDPRGFQDLVDEAKRRIPHYCPEWTDHNVSDPGVTLIELFAWMVDVLLYRLNQVPDRDYLAFLDLIGVRPRPAVPAVAELLFWLTDSRPGELEIPAGTVVARRQTDASADPIAFSTNEPLIVRTPKVTAWIKARGATSPGRDGELVADVSQQLAYDTSDVLVFDDPPRDGDCFYLGFAERLAGHVVRLTVRCEANRASNIVQQDPPLLWEYWSGNAWKPTLPGTSDGSSPAASAPDRPWASNEVALLRRIEPDAANLGPRLDDTAGLNQDGRVLIFLPRDFEPHRLFQSPDPARYGYWVRCRAVQPRDANRSFFDNSPRLLGVRAESIGGLVIASHCVEAPEEELGRSDGTPGQSFRLRNTPILPRRRDGAAPETVGLDVGDEKRAGGTAGPSANGVAANGQKPAARPVERYELWTEVESFAGSNAASPHFVVEDRIGEVRFGPRLELSGGEARQYGRVPPKGRRILFTRYRIGGGKSGNVAAGALDTTKSAVAYVKWVRNLSPATGGRDAETLDEYKLRGSELVRTRDVAITRNDFERIALAATQRVARVRCVAGAPAAPAAPPARLAIGETTVALTGIAVGMVSGASGPEARVRTVPLPPAPSDGHSTSPDGGGTARIGPDGARSPAELPCVQLLIVPAMATVDQVVPPEELFLTDEARDEVIKTIKNYLADRTPLATEVAVRIVDYKAVSVRPSLVIRKRPDLDEARKQANRERIRAEASRRLCSFIHPAAGGPDGHGWPFGRSLTLGDVYPLLETIDGVSYVGAIDFCPVPIGSDAASSDGPGVRVVHLGGTEILCSADHAITLQDEET